MAKTNAYSGGNKQHSFAMVPSAEQSRSSFDRSSNYKTTLSSGKLVPIFCEEILPGDTVTLNPSMFCRMATPIFPVMDNMYLDSQFFFVPNRLVWDKWAYFLGEEEVPGDSELAPKYAIPQIDAPPTGFAELSTADYLGLPTKVPGISVSALPFRCINIIFNEWYRDENLVPRVPQIKVGGIIDQGTGNVPVVDFDAMYLLNGRGKRHDYFTSGLPWPQKGPSVLLPLSGSAPVVGTGAGIPTFKNQTGGAIAFLQTSGTSQPNLGWPTSSGGDVIHWESPSLAADLTQSSGATINELRQSFAIQRLLERDARGGTRLTEIINAHFGVKSPDARLQRPEYLGGGSINISVNPVPQTSGTAADTGYTDTPQGNLSAFAVGIGSGGGFTQSFTEHGHIIGFVSIRADLSYQQGINRAWSRKTRFDFYWPALQNIGEMAILNKEIYAQGNATDAQVFAYQERWAEYRYKPSLITGQFRSNAALTLDSWHLAQDFQALPTLSKAFITDTPPIARVVAVPSEPEFLLDVYFKMKHARVLPVFSVPGLIDHF
ncbi:MAG: major capsid protein [Microvirus sp.]|nr:MAG: major capsid protein [Microvirus sp.]